MEAASSGIEYCPSGKVSTSERERLILEHLPQVRSIAYRIHERLPSSIYLEDLVATGIIGLINAVDSYDASFGVKLKTYAEYRIRGAILDSIRGLDGIPAHKRGRIKQIEAAILRLEQRLMRPPAEEEIAAELGIGAAEYQEWLQDVQGVSIGSLDAVPENGQGLSLIHYIADREDDTPACQFERAELEKLLSDAIQKMPEVERLVLSLYYQEEQGLKEIAAIMNLHLTRVSQLKSQAVIRLRSYIRKRWPTGKGIY
ncbi:MAG: FliA/WhiG family RNA polymerase sigma factor [Candidatus Solibacter usitatus]|nr:FliA/WhiG family RNA polymerase sigma factor [Candidatus Solibacter usitatus]